MAQNQTANPDYSILAAFDRPIVQPKAGFLYQVCLLLVAAAMLVLTLIYFAFVGGLIWLTFYHAVYNWWPIMKWGGSLGSAWILIFKFAVYLVPLLAGLVLIFFMFKPLLAARPRRAQPLALNPSDNPLLYAFIAKVCDVVGAPAPQRIDMDCGINASASFRRGFRSMARNDMVLKIGLPLVANLTASEFAGVVAHEFGHFTQGAGMRLSYVIRSINFWFERVAYERDAWDEALQQWSDEVENGREAIIVWSLQLMIGFSRLFLKVLFYTGHIVAGFMLRQREYDADAYHIMVSGSKSFETTHRKLATLSAALRGTRAQIRSQWRKSAQLPDNVSELLRQIHGNLPPNVLQKVEHELALRRTSLFDAHPSPADRIRRARLAAKPGIFHDERPASALFASFEHPARFVTLLYYTDNLGIPVTEKMLQHVESTQAAEAKGYAANKMDPVDDFFLGLLPLMQPWRIEVPAPSVDVTADLTELHEFSTSLQKLAGQVAPMAAEYKEVSKQWQAARAAERLLGMGVAIDPQNFGLAVATLEAAKAAESDAAKARDALNQSLREVTAALNRRMQLALAIRLAESGETDALDEMNHLVNELNAAAVDYDNREETVNALEVLNHINTVRQVTGETPALTRALDAQRNFVQSLNAAPEETSPEPAPSGQQQLHITKQPKHPGPAEMEAIRLKTNQWFADYRQKIGRIVDIAQSVERG